MDTQLFTLSKIFTERLFRIPDYQRGYAWNEPQWKDFWNDLEQIADGSNHYTGVLTLETVPDLTSANWQDDKWIIENKSYEPLYVVDGQQRLTTSIILIQAIIENFQDQDTLNYTTILDIKRKFIFESKDGGISKSYIFGYDKDNPSYEFLKTKIFSQFSSSERFEETIYTNNLMRAKNYFTEKLKKMETQEIEILFRKLTQNLLFNIFAISKEIDVCVAFETMNNRGKALSYLELLKNRLIYLSLKLPDDESEKDTLRTAINNCWKAIYHNLGRNKDRPLDDDLFLGSHYEIYFAPAKKDMVDEESEDPIVKIKRRRSRRDHYEKLLEEIFVTKRINFSTDKDNLNLKKIHEYVESLQIAVNSWYEMFNPKTVTTKNNSHIWLDKLNRLDSNEYLSLILSVMLAVKNDDQRVEIFKSLERFIFIQRLISFNYVDFDFTHLAVKLHRSEISVKSLIETINNLSKASLRFLESVSKDFYNRFKNIGFYRWRPVKYFLYEYNLSLQEKSKTQRGKIDWEVYNNENESDYYSVEHIYPQTPKDKYWKVNFNKYTKKQRDALTHSLGNLVPLSKPKNSSLSNKPFPEKVAGTSGQANGFIYGSYAENEIAAIEDWTPGEIRKRGLKLLAFMEKRWNLQLGTEDDKLELLNLSFLKDS